MSPPGDPPAPPGGTPGRGHRRRRAARRQAVEILYQADVTGEEPSDVAAAWRAAGRTVAPYALELVEGVERDLPVIDALLDEDDADWPLSRMAVVDRTILRVACYELGAGLPPAVVINEAVEAAVELSTEDSGRFVNGVLARIARGRDGPAGATG